MIIPQWLFQKTKAFTIHLPFSPGNGSFVKTLTISFHFISVSHRKKIKSYKQLFWFCFGGKRGVGQPYLSPIQKELFSTLSQPGKCPNMEFFCDPYFPAFGLNTEKYSPYVLSVFSPNAGKYGPGKTPYLDTFHTVYILWDYHELTPFPYKHFKVRLSPSKKKLFLLQWKLFIKIPFYYQPKSSIRSRDI